MIELTEDSLTLFDYKDRARYSYNLSSIIIHRIRINPKPLNAKIEKKTDTEAYLLAQALHFLNESEQMISKYS